MPQEFQHSALLQRESLGWQAISGPVGYGAAQAIRPIQGTSVVTGQETPFHPPPWATVPQLFPGKNVILDSQYIWGTHSTVNLPQMGALTKISPPIAYGAVQAIRPLGGTKVVTTQEIPNHPLPWSSIPLIIPTAINQAIGQNYTWGIHSSQYELGFRGYRSLSGVSSFRAALLQSTAVEVFQEPGQNGYSATFPVVAYGAIQAVKPLQSTFAVTTQEIPGHPLPLTGKPLTPIVRLGSQISTVQEIPDHPKPSVSGPYLLNFGYLGQQVVTRQEIPTYYPANVSPPLFGLAGPGVVQNSYRWGMHSTLNESQFRGLVSITVPLSFTAAPISPNIIQSIYRWGTHSELNEYRFRGLARVAGPTSFVAPTPITGGPVQNWYFWGTNDALRRDDRDGFIYLSCGMASYADLGQQIWTQQELPDHPLPWTQTGTNLQRGGFLGGQIVTLQEFPFHPGPWSRQEFNLRHIGFLGQQVILGQELPFHPGSWIFNGLVIPLPTASLRAISVPQEWPFTGSTPSWTIGPVGYGRGQAITPLQGTGVITTLEIPGHPLPWVEGGPALRIRLPGFGQVIIALQEWPFVGSGGAQPVSIPVGFGQTQRPLQGTRPFTVQETPFHPGPWVVGGPVPILRLPSGQQIFVPQMWPFVGTGGAQFTSGSVGFGFGQAAKPLQNIKTFTVQEIPGHPGPWVTGPLLKTTIQGFGQGEFLVQEWPFVGQGGQQFASSPPLPNFGFLGTRLFIPDQPWAPDHDGYLFFVCGMGNQPADPFWPVMVRELYPDYHPLPWTQTGFGFFEPLSPTRRYVRKHPWERYVVLHPAPDRFARLVPDPQYVIRAYRFVDQPLMAQLPDLPNIAPNQAQTMGIDFGPFLPPSVTLVGTPSLNLSVHIGNDPMPQTRLVSGPIVGTINPNIGGTGLTNTSVIFKLANCLSGVTYTIETDCGRSDGDIVDGWTRIQCVAPS